MIPYEEYLPLLLHEYSYALYLSYEFDLCMYDPISERYPRDEDYASDVDSDSDFDYDFSDVEDEVPPWLFADLEEENGSPIQQENDHLSIVFGSFGRNSNLEMTSAVSMIPIIPEIEECSVKIGEITCYLTAVKQQTNGHQSVISTQNPMDHSISRLILCSEDLVTTLGHLGHAPTLSNKLDGTVLFKDDLVVDSIPKVVEEQMEKVPKIIQLVYSEIFLHCSEILLPCRWNAFIISCSQLCCNFVSLESYAMGSSHCKIVPVELVSMVSSPSPRFDHPAKPPDMIVALFSSHSLINFYSKCGYSSNACQVLDEMPKQDVVSWAALIQGFMAQSTTPIPILGASGFFVHRLRAIVARVLNNGRGHGRGRVKTFTVSAVSDVASSIAVIAV